MTTTGPTRIVAPPRRVAGKHGDRGGRWRLMLQCDDGRTYTIKELSAVVGIPVSSIRTRIHAAGWDDPDVLLRGRKQKKESEGTAEWMALSNRPRSQRLLTIAQPGRLERSYCHQEESPCQP